MTGKKRRVWLLAAGGGVATVLVVLLLLIHQFGTPLNRAGRSAALLGCLCVFLGVLSSVFLRYMVLRLLSEESRCKIASSECPNSSNRLNLQQ